MYFFRQTGRIGKQKIRFVEPKNPKKIFQGFKFIVTGCKAVNEQVNMIWKV